MDTKIVRLSDSTQVGTRLYPTLRRVLNGSKNGAPIRFYMGVKLSFMKDLKLFRVYELKRVLSRSYPTVRKVLYVPDRVLYGTKHCYARPFQTPRAHLAKFVNLCPRYNPFRSFQTPIPSIQEITDRSTVDPFRQPERTWPNLSIYVSAMSCSDPVRRLYL